MRTVEQFDALLACFVQASSLLLVFGTCLPPGITCSPSQTTSYIMSDNNPVGRPPPPDENAGSRIIAATLIVTSLALLTSCGRVWVRLRIIRSVSSDVRVLSSPVLGYFR